VAVTSCVARVFEGMRVWRLDDASFRLAARLIAGAERPHRPEAVIGIERGGRDLATVLSLDLGVPAVMVKARHNATDDVTAPATGSVTADPAALDRLPAAGRLLIADDISGSGLTLTVVRSLVAARYPAAAIRTAVLCRNAGSRHAPDTWVWDVADWVVFPWEEPPAGITTEPLPEPLCARHP
jgi:uncharacterized protein